MDGIASPLLTDVHACPTAMDGLDLLGAHQLAHDLNGALLEAAGAAAGISLRVGDPGEPDLLPGIWTAVLRSDVDGPGGVFVMVVPAAMAWGMPDTSCTVRSGTSWNTARLRVTAALDAAAAARLAVAVRTGSSTMVLLDGPMMAVAPGVFARAGLEKTVVAPLAYRLF